MCIRDSIKAAYGIRSEKDSTEKKTKSWSVGVDHMFSQSTKAYLVYADVKNFNYSDDDDPGDWKAVSLGLVHNF